MNHPFPVADLESEQAYDALVDALSVANRLLEAPRSRDELAALFPAIEPRALDRHIRRLIRSGIVVERDERLEATSQNIHSLQQSGQREALSEIYVPALLGLVLDPTMGMLLQLNLWLEPDEQERLYQDHVAFLFKDLAEFANEASEGTEEHYVLVIGTPHVPSGGDGLDRSLEILRLAARDRADPDRRSRSLASYFQACIPSPERLLKTVSQFESRFSASRAEPGLANYSLILGAGRRLQATGDHV